MKSALLVIDVQNGICSGEWPAHDIDGVIGRINQLIGRARAAGTPVVVVQHEEDDGALVFGTEGWQLDGRLAVLPQDIRIRKTATNSFHRTELQSLLQEQGVDHLVVCGLQSEFCIDATVRGALALGYPVDLVADAHTTLEDGVTPAARISALHNATLANLAGDGPRVATTPAAEVRIHH